MEFKNKKDTKLHRMNIYIIKKIYKYIKFYSIKKSIRKQTHGQVL